MKKNRKKCGCAGFALLTGAALLVLIFFPVKLMLGIAAAALILFGLNKLFDC
ncbi:MAG: hypothetical protein FWG69_03670 [Oscillospiraceae bacterium]|nr:hypothetical protein [Oscillospiraceae bacterium]